jgi:hypothetical protein
MYNYRYLNGKIDAAVGVTGDGGASALCSKYISQQYDRCAQGYSDGFNHFTINSSVVETGAYVHTPEYEYGYN